MRKIFPLTQVEFDDLLKWLSPNREEAGEVYEKIRQGLIRYFSFKGCSDPEGLADETINRVAKKLPDFDLSTGHKPITFFYGFASKVYLEDCRQNQKQVDLEEIPPAKKINFIPDDNEPKFECLNNCLKNLSGDDQNLVIQYYSPEKNERQEQRRKLAENLNMTTNNLHVKVHRLKGILRPCLKKCLNDVRN